jgi:gag-polypeptide of LTR copia-type
MSNDRINITKLAMDGLNWVTYRNCMLWAFASRQWSHHLDTITVPPSYINTGIVNRQTPQEHWDVEEAAARQLIASSVPDHIFNQIKSKNTTHKVWDTLKSLYQT